MQADRGRDPPDKLLLSALKYWEVERDLIEERLATHEVCGGCVVITQCCTFLGPMPAARTE